MTDIKRVLDTQKLKVSGLAREQLVKACQGLSRTRIQRVLAKADGQRRDLTTQDVLRSIEETVPLAAIARDQISDLKRWAAEAGARTASQDTQLVDELKQYTIQRGIGPLEVD